MKYAIVGWMMLAVWTVFPVVAQEPAPGWKGDLAFGLSSTSGNSDTSSMSFSFSADWRTTGPWTWKNKGTYLKSDNEQETTADVATLDTRLEWKRHARWFAYGQAGYMRDRFKDYDYRLTPGAGFGWQVLKREDRALQLTAGLSAVMLKYRASGETDSYAALEIGNEFAWKVSQSTDFKQSFVANMDVSEPDRYFLKVEMSLSVAINSRWGVKLSFTDSYDNQPVSLDVKQNDTQMIAGITYRFGS